MKYTKELEARKKEIIAAAGKCERCGATNRPLTIDHIVPISILEMMGMAGEDTFDEENFAVLCTPCNATKRERLDFGNPKTKAMLLKYLERM